MKRFKFVGETAVDVPAIGVVDVQPGQRVEVEDSDVSASMEKQPDTWEHIPDPKRSRAAKQAAETREHDTEES